MAPAGTTNLLWFQGAQPVHVRVESSSVCFPEIELMSLDPQHFSSKQTEKRIPVHSSSHV